VRWCIPSVGIAGAVLELEPIAIPFVEVMICARTATVGEAVAVKSRDGVEALNTSGVSRRSQRNPRDRLGL
jgi:hydrogenase/urease accessory protein HupE